MGSGELMFNRRGVLVCEEGKHSGESRGVNMSPWYCMIYAVELCMCCFVNFEMHHGVLLQHGLSSLLFVDYVFSHNCHDLFSVDDF